MIRREPTFRRPTYASRRLMILRRARFPYGHVRLAIQPGCRAPTGLLVTLEVGGDVVGHPGRAVLIGGVEGVPAERRAGGRRDAVDLRLFGRGGRRGGRPPRGAGRAQQPGRRLVVSGETGGSGQSLQRHAAVRGAPSVREARSARRFSRLAWAAAGLRVGTADAITDVRVHRTGRMDGPDLVIEATGSPAGLRLALELVRDGGEVVLLGTPRGTSTSDTTNLMSAIHYRGLRLTGGLEWLLPLHSSPWSARWSLYDSYHTLIGLLRSGALALGGWQVRTVSPDEAQAVYSELADEPPHAQAVVFDWAPRQRATS